MILRFLDRIWGDLNGNKNSPESPPRRLRSSKTRPPSSLITKFEFPEKRIKMKIKSIEAVGFSYNNMYVRIDFNKKVLKTIKHPKTNTGTTWSTPWEIECYNVSCLIFEVWYQPSHIKKICAGQAMILPAFYDNKHPISLQSRPFKNDVVMGSLIFDTEIEYI